MTESGLARLRTGQARARERAVEECRVVSVLPLQRRYLELKAQDRIQPHLVASEMGWTRDRRGTGRYGDVSRLDRALGLRPHGRDPRMRGEQRCSTTIRYEVALKLADLLGMDPVEAGL